MELRPPECFVDIDVSEPGDGALIEERRFDRRAATLEPLSKPSRRERSLERFDAQSLVKIVVELAGLEQLPRTEPADVAIRHTRSVVQLDNSASMRIVAQLSPRRVSQAPRHPEVNQQSPSRFEPDNQILAPTLERGDSLAFQFGRDGGGLERPHEPRIANVHAVEAPADEVRLQLKADRFDLWELGH
jgi:hypothetical protein